LGTPNLINLYAVENAIFVVDLISKTRDAGLTWKRLAPYLFTITLDEPCFGSSAPPNIWSFYVGRNQANDTALSYVFYIEVLLNSVLNLYTDSRQTNYVEQLYQAIELAQVPQNSWRINQAIDFMSSVPTNPFAATISFTACGGVFVDGFGVVMAIYNPVIVPSGVTSGGIAPVSLILAGQSLIVTTSTVQATEALFGATLYAQGNVRATGYELYSAHGLLSANSLFGPGLSATSFVFSASPGNYTVILTNTGLGPIGTFWMAWTPPSSPSRGYLPTLPTNLTPPTGWTATITNGPPPTDGYSIQFVASNPSFNMLPQSSLAFSFNSTDLPTTLAGISTIHPPTPVSTSAIYSGVPFSGPSITIELESILDVGIGRMTTAATINADGTILYGAQSRITSSDMIHAAGNSIYQAQGILQSSVVLGSALNATGAIVGAFFALSEWNYAIRITNTGSGHIGTLWLAWVPGQGYLPTMPTGFAPPTGWTATLTNGPPPTDGYSIQFVASNSSFYLTSGNSVVIGFQSADSPSILAGTSSIHPPTPIGTSIIYSGAPFSGVGFPFVVTSTLQASQSIITDTFTLVANANTSHKAKAMIAANIFIQALESAIYSEQEVLNGHSTIQAIAIASHIAQSMIVTKSSCEGNADARLQLFASSSTQATGSVKYVAHQIINATSVVMVIQSDTHNAISVLAVQSNLQAKALDSHEAKSVLAGQCVVLTTATAVHGSKLVLASQSLVHGTGNNAYADASVMTSQCVIHALVKDFHGVSSAIVGQCVVRANALVARNAKSAMLCTGSIQAIWHLTHNAQSAIRATSTIRSTGIATYYGQSVLVSQSTILSIGGLVGVVSQSWDGVASGVGTGSIANWNIPNTSPIAATQILTTNTFPGSVAPISGPNALCFLKQGGTPPSALATFFVMNETSDTNSGNVIVQAYFLVGANDQTIGGGLIARANSFSITQTSGFSFYWLQVHLNSGGGSGLIQINPYSGSALGALIGSSVTFTPTTQIWYLAILNCNGSTFTGSLQNVSSGLWLNSSGTFVSGETAAITGTDTSITGAGFAGLSFTTRASLDEIYTDNWQMTNS
jgi:hypothetical protein